MRTTLARWLRRAADRLDPPRITWTLTTNPSTWVSDTGDWTATVWEYPNRSVA